MPTPDTGTGPGWDTPNTAAQTANPKRGEPGSAIELRKQRQTILDQIQKIESNPDVPADPTSGTNAQLSTKQQQAVDSLYQQVTTLSKDIQDFESTPQRAPAVRENVNPGPDVPYIQTLNPDGTITVQSNANYTGQIKPVVEHQGNHTVVITPPTPEERAAGQTQPHVTVAYTDQDAQELANRQTAVAESNAAVAKANQDLNDFVQHTKAEIDQAVARGEDAASLRASRALDLQEKYQAAQIASTQAQTAQAALNEYNTNRHNLAQEQLTREQIQATKDAQAAQDQVTQRGQEITSADTTYSTQANMANQRLAAGNTYMGNLWGLLQKMNADAPPGSDVVARAIPAFLSLGQKFFENIGGLTNPQLPTPSPNLPPRTGGPAGSAPPTTLPDISTLYTNAGLPSSNVATPTISGYNTSAGYQGAPNPNVFGGGTGAVPTPPAPALSPDGTPMASVQDVARAFGRAA